MTQTRQASILLFAMEGLFSRRVFESLLQQGVHFSGVVLPGRSSITHKAVSDNKLNVLNSESVASLARYHKIPVYYVQGKAVEDYQAVLKLPCPDIILVACFPYLLPASVFQRTLRGAYNIHPSLLPAYKGPVPLFWQFYYGDTLSGITIHLIDQGFDSGDIVLQQGCQLEDGCSSSNATASLAAVAVTLVPPLLDQIATDSLSTYAQDKQGASYFSWPGLEQFTLSTQWTAHRAFNFIRGTQHWNQTYQLIDATGKHLMKIDKAITYATEPDKIANPDAANRQHWIKFEQGYLLVQC